MQSLDKNVFSQVKKTIQRFTLSSSTVEEKKELNPLITMNIPAWVARRDAAYGRAVKLLKEHVFTLSEQQRRELYKAVLKLLGIAIDATRSIGAVTLPQKKMDKSEGGPILQYLLLLNDTVNAAHALVNHEVILEKDEKDLTNFIGGDISNQFLSSEEVFSNSEMNIYHSINDLLDVAKASITKFQDYRRRSFSKSDFERYNKSLAEFQTLYQQIGTINKS